MAKIIIAMARRTAQRLINLKGTELRLTQDNKQFYGVVKCDNDTKLSELEKEYSSIEIKHHGYYYPIEKECSK